MSVKYGATDVQGKNEETDKEKPPTVEIHMR